jgi:serine/threonine protein kinase
LLREQSWGRYEIRSKIGKGRMEEIYLAEDTKLDRNVALKILTAEVAANRDRMRRFVQEAKAAAALRNYRPTPCGSGGDCHNKQLEL